VTDITIFKKGFSSVDGDDDVRGVEKSEAIIAKVAQL
jgi:hypothetical protein